MKNTIGSIISTTVAGIAASVLLATTVSAVSFADMPNKVQAQISPFSHNIVFTDFYNYATEYPILLYKNVSYIPLTSSMCKELYLSCAFTPEDGLYVARGGGGTSTIGSERTQVLGAVDYTNPADGNVIAVIPEYSVYINGRKYEDAEYPALNFRCITYIPLTYDIVRNEFDFEFEFDNEKKHLTLYGNSWYSTPYFSHSADGYLEITDNRSVYSEYLDEYGNTGYRHEYDYTEYYRLYTDNDTVTKMPAEYKSAKKEKAPEKEQDPRFTIKDDYVWFEDTQLVKLPHLSGNGWSYEGNASAEIYDYDDTTFIVVTTWTNIALPRGTTRQHHIFVKDSDGIKKLDWTDVFTKLIYDGNGAWYLCSSSGNTMYGNPFAEIYRYTKENGLERLSDRYENINSLEYIGTYNGKMYVFAALREGNRDVGYSGESLNPIYSGYYEIDENLNLRKIGNFMGTRANVTLAENGNLYLITGYSSLSNRLINLNTGEIIKIFN